MGRFCDNKNLFFENGRQKINLIITFLKNEKIWILKMLYGKHLLDFWNTCTFFKIFFTCQLAMFLSVRQTPCIEGNSACCLIILHFFENWFYEIFAPFFVDFKNHCAAMDDLQSMYSIGWYDVEADFGRLVAIQPLQNVEGTLQIFG